MEVEFFRVADILNYSRLDIRVKRVERPFNGSFCYPARGTTNRRSRISLSLSLYTSLYNPRTRGSSSSSRASNVNLGEEREREKERIRIATNLRAEKIRRNDPRVCFGTK